MFATLLTWAESGAKQPSGGFSELPIMLIIMAGLFLVLVVLPGRRRERKEREALLANLKKNDKVLTIAGMYGTVISVSDKEDEVVVKVDDNTRIRMTKGSIARNLTAEENAKAQQGQKDPKKEGVA